MFPYSRGGAAPCFLSLNVYDYLIDGMASVQSEKWASLIKEDSLRQSMETKIFTIVYYVNNFIIMITK